MNPYFNPRSAILLAIIIQAVVTAFLVMKRANHKNRQSDKFLAILLLLMGLSLTDFVIGFLGFYDQYPRLTFFPFVNLFAVSALLYLFCLSLLQKDKPNKRTIKKHLIIPAVYLVSHFIVFLLPTNTKEEFLSEFYFPFFVYMESLFFYIISGYYLVHIFKILQKHSQIANENYAQISTAVLNWLRYFVIGFAMYIAIDFILSSSSVLFNFGFEQQYWKYVLRALLTSFLCIAGYNFDENVSFRNIEFQKATRKSETKEEMVTENELQNYKQKILSFFNEEKPFLESELDLNQLSKYLGMNSNVLSYVINRGFDKNFNDFINGYRVTEVIENLKNPANSNFTILSIALNCGFNSKTTFNRVFKKVTKKSPKEFLRQTKKTT